jgi:hypothetical protein
MGAREEMPMQTVIGCVVVGCVPRGAGMAIPANKTQGTRASRRQRPRLAPSRQGHGINGRGCYQLSWP